MTVSVFPPPPFSVHRGAWSSSCEDESASTRVLLQGEEGAPAGRSGSVSLAPGAGTGGRDRIHEGAQMHQPANTRVKYYKTIHR